MPCPVAGDRLEQLVAQVASSPVLRREGAGVRLIHDHQLRTGAREFVAPAGGLDIVGRDHDVGIEVEQRLAHRRVPL